jgi:hypothetical protein
VDCAQCEYGDILIRMRSFPMEAAAVFLREKAEQCRTMANSGEDVDAMARSLLALALELEAQALALEAGAATSREVERVETSRPGDNTHH